MRLLRRLFVWGLVAMIWIGIVGAGSLAWYAYDLPKIDRFLESERQPSVTLLYSNGSVLATFGEQYGQSLKVDQLPPALPQAVIAIEDRRFYKHFGFDPIGLLRAAYVNFRAGRIVQGGSTITQQLAKNLFLKPERTIKRKAQEFLLALWLEDSLSKDQILALYLNRVYFGAGAYGVDAAARRFFGKSAKSVNLYEAALLAGLLRAPARYNPANSRSASDTRTKLVLQAMVEAGFITQAQASKAAKTKSRGVAAANRRGRYFSDWVLSQVTDFVGRPDRDLVVVTTLNPSMQRHAERSLWQELKERGKKGRAGQAALVSLDTNGAVRAMVGGRSYRHSQFNRATQALRQPGSAFKLFVYLAALESGLVPDDPFVDAPVSIGDWAPRNYNEKYYDQVTMREAFARSLNSVAVRISEKVGRKRVISVARRLGITSDLNPHPSLALGASEVSLIELTGAYASLANNGNGVWPHGILEIRDTKGKVLYKRRGGGPGRVVASQQVNQLNQMLSATVEWGTGKRAAIGRPVAGKTGTSQEFRDAWFVGYSAELVTGVWFGNDNGRPMKKVTGGTLPARLWARYMKRALQGVPVKSLPTSGEMVVAEEKKPAEGFINGLLERLQKPVEQKQPVVGQVQESDKVLLDTLIESIWEENDRGR